MTIWYAFWPFWYALWSCGMLFQNHRKLQLRKLKVKTLFQLWHKKKTKFIMFMGTYSTYWEPSCTTRDLRSHVALLDTQLMEYGPTHQTIIWFSISSSHCWEKLSLDTSLLVWWLGHSPMLVVRLSCILQGLHPLLLPDLMS